MSLRSRQRRDKRAEIPDEAALSRLWANGAEAWAGVPDAAAWVDELRGNTMSEDQFQALRDAPTPIGPDVGSGRNMYFAGQHSAEEPADTAVRLALVAQRDALLAEVERLRAALESPLQGGMSNNELREAWGKKLPGVEPNDRDLSAFAIGVEVGNVGRDCYFAERNSARDAWRERVKQCEALAAEVERLTAELAAALVDAERYRRNETAMLSFMRALHPDLPQMFHDTTAKWNSLHPNAPIDAARTA